MGKPVCDIKILRKSLQAKAMKDQTDRYSRQEIFAPIGKDGQRQIRNAKVLVVGCGALGTNIASLLARAGTGFLRIVDRDIVELSNLQRQVMFDEQDVRERLPKSRAALRHLQKINSEVKVEALVKDVNPRSITPLVDGIDIVLDATDNFEVRYLVNDLCVKEKIPWIYGGVIGASGATMSFVPEGPCLSCVWPDPPQTGQTPTCHTAGVLNTAPALIGAIQVTEAIKIMVGKPTRSTLWHLELWEGQTAAVRVEKNDSCPVCGKDEYRYLNAEATSWVTSLCGRDAVQIVPADSVQIDLETLEKKLRQVGTTHNNGYMLGVEIEGVHFTIFPDSRVIVHGVTDEAKARSLHARYIGL